MLSAAHTKVGGSSRRHNLALQNMSVQSRKKNLEVSYWAATLEENDLLARSGTVSKSADGFSRLISISSQQVVQALMPDRSHEPLALPLSALIISQNSTSSRLNLHVRSGKTTESIVAQRRILNQNWAFHLHIISLDNFLYPSLYKR
jgi:hypothetical protein